MPGSGIRPCRENSIQACLLRIAGEEDDAVAQFEGFALTQCPRIGQEVER